MYIKPRYEIIRASQGLRTVTAFDIPIDSLILVSVVDNVLA